MERGGSATAIKTDPAPRHSPWQTGCPASTPPHSVHETAKDIGKDMHGQSAEPSYTQQRDEEVVALLQAEVKKQLPLSSPSALVLMDVELLTLAIRRMAASGGVGGGQLDIFNDTLPWASPV
ncbi:hypothetical protein NQZ68_040672 [Dissostichus eleginoides]|nr:hypothetical protein NQZ68_040672 [Dissostichus eleginoides]